MDSAFAAAYIDNGNSYRFLGVKVRPFCLWHLFLLDTIDSPFIKGGIVTSWDLRTAIGACRLKYLQSRIRRPILRCLTRNDLKWEVARFVEYIGDYAAKIDYNIVPFGKEEKSTVRIVPPPNVVITAFKAAHGARVPIDVAWNMPLAQAHIAEAMYFHLQGSRVNFMDDEERQFQKEMKEAGIK